ncbi:type VI secretion system-associated protein TagF [Gallaecimonas kandeliae]|uniref:type VI secretion system-associated protein TagF n=1 Tax=Gallaecimonas kandeliae TaxID=3029055 RepID=UPI002649BC5A|nr:type VI secretion system-associated protein TagF [Gallaecimonas kandeliae]WKE65744.1 type VI secretion system-associated protein TagF [Gallaecimonas kandeliae]
MQWGYMGKVPNRGDFLCHNLAPQVRDLFFEWCQAGLAVSREQLGEDWTDAYLTSPVWHFAAAPGLLAESGLLGTLIPSVDKVGRHFPFLALGEFQGSALQAWREGQWSAELEELVPAVLDDHWQEGDWRSRLAAVPLPQGQGRRLHWPQAQGNLVLPAASEAELLQSLVAREGEPMIWWTQGSAFVEPVMLMTRGLPQVGQFAAMLAAQWQQHGWQQGMLTE